MPSETFNKLAIFVDGPNLHATARALGVDIDFKRLLAHFQTFGTLVRAFYYTIFHDQEFSSVRPLVDWLDYNGFTVVTKEAKEFTDSSRHRKVRGKLAVELAVAAAQLAKHLDEVILLSGDSDFRSLVASLQRRGVRVTVVSSLACQPPMIADDLRRQADAFIDLRELQDRLCRAPVKHFARSGRRSQSRVMPIRPNKNRAPEF
ncbi:NYN domain-containing protein [Bradyrhizobium sp. DASA03076]|uniref:LabA-like NYN domain-containing protein n=1 Tax=Bradyrhizobium sp. BLXBL-03 TaxID=3395916 RepID=UPI003F6F6A6D